MSFLVLAVPADLAAGRYAAPSWAILALGGAVVAGAAVYLGVRSYRRSPAPSRPSPPPHPPEEKR